MLGESADKDRNPLRILTGSIRRRARELGFDPVGFIPATPLPADEAALRKWLRDGMAGDMGYMARDPGRRADPRKSLPGARTVICLSLNYYPGDPPEAVGLQGRVSRYAWGRDYHHILEEKLAQLIRSIQELAGREVRIKPYVDYGPLLERAYATRAGLGFIGKNTMLITRDFGSWVFLAELITDLELEMDTPGDSVPPSLCGNCTLCLDVCPTEAFTAPFKLDATRCISYLTIEHKGEISPALRHRMEDWIFGCDLCQEVCPYNEQTPRATRDPFRAGAGPWVSPDKVLAMDDKTFHDRYRETPLLRPKLKGLRENARAVMENQQQLPAETIPAEKARIP